MKIFPLLFVLPCLFLAHPLLFPRPSGGFVLAGFIPPPERGICFGGFVVPRPSGGFVLSGFVPRRGGFAALPPPAFGGGIKGGGI